MIAERGLSAMADQESETQRRLYLGVWIAALIAVAIPAVAYSDDLQPGIDNRDTLEKATGAPNEAEALVHDHFDVLVGGQFTYDDNLYRLPSATNVTTVVGPNATRQDHIDTASLGLNGQRTFGRQIITFDVRAEDNRFAQNSDLNNVSDRDRVLWRWELGSLLSGQAGAEYNKYLAGFVNSTVYTRNLVSTTDYFGAGRYQIGPHWALFGGVYDTATTLSSLASQGNDNDTKSVDLGTEYGIDPNDSVGLEYRYTDTYFSHSPVPADSDYREDTERVLLKYAITNRTLIDASVGYKKRIYTAITTRDFSGDIWRATLQWQMTEKTKLVTDVWRKLQAYETAESDYFVTTGGSVASVWMATEKLTLSIDLSRNDEKYIGPGSTASTQVPRHDIVSAEHASVIYTPMRTLILTLSYGYERRTSNYSQYAYDDSLASANATLKF
jgi:hypothetical protein